MKVSVSNDVKCYDLSAGKALPEWITDKKRRKLEQRDVDIRRRIQLMQDCQMPCASQNVCFSPDGRYLFATGTYKPILKCFDVDELSQKFERGLDADVIKTVVLSDDYSKVAMLEEERYIELHTSYGRHHRLRIPHFGRDMSFCRENSELFIVGCRSEVFRLSLEEGRFHEPLKSTSASLTCCQFNDDHQLFVCGTEDGKVEAWDYRDRRRVAELDCVRNNNIALEFDMDNPNIPEVTCVKFKDALHLGVGLGSGHVLLYDIRSAKPQLIKDHRMGLPIRKLDFIPQQDLVLSMDPRVLKIWYESDGQPFTSIEPGVDLNDFCRFPNSGLLFFACDAPKMQQFFVPSLGPAPRWCSHLESITEELEQTEQPGIYDDYKFVTKAQLEEIGLGSLIGTSMLRAYMHGYFISMGVYEKARTANQPIAYEIYKKRKLQERLDEERQTHVIRKKAGLNKLPKVNTGLAEKLQLERMTLDDNVQAPSGSGQADTTAGTVLSDERFKELFEDGDFEIDPQLDQINEETRKRLVRKKAKKKHSRN